MYHRPPSSGHRRRLSQRWEKLYVHLRMGAEGLCLATSPVGPSKAGSSVRDDPSRPWERHRRIRQTKPRVWGLADFASRNKNRVPQAEGDMTLLVWPGSKLECGLSNERNISERVDGSIHSSTVKLMEPAPPG